MAKTKALISCAVTAQLICIFVFAYANCLFSHAKAHNIISCLKMGIHHLYVFSLIGEINGLLRCPTSKLKFKHCLSHKNSTCNEKGSWHRNSCFQNMDIKWLAMVDCAHVPHNSSFNTTKLIFFFFFIQFYVPFKIISAHMRRANQ